MQIKLKHKKYKVVLNILRLCKAGLGAIGMTFVITDFKWIGVGVLVLAAISNEGIEIIKDTEQDENTNI